MVIGEESCRKTVYVEAKRLKSFVTENVVDLQSVDNELNESEEINILTQHCCFRERFSFDTLLLFTKHKTNAAYRIVFVSCSLSTSSIRNSCGLFKNLAPSS
jgi:hypothetical protein